MLRRGTAWACWMPLSACLAIGLAASLASAQEASIGNGRPGDVAFDVPIAPPTDAINAAASSDCAGRRDVAALHELQRLPTVDRDTTAPTDLGPRSDLGSGFGGMGMGMGMGMGSGLGGQGPINYRTFWFPTEPVKGQAANWEMVGQDFSFAYPLWVDSPNRLMLTAGVRNRLIDTDAILPDSHQPYPSELWRRRWA